MSIFADAQIVMMILNCQKYRYKAEIQKREWLIPRFIGDVPFFHVIGEPDGDRFKSGSNYEFDLENHILYLKCPDDYVSLPKKVIMAMTVITLKFPKLRYLFKTDDDHIMIDDQFFVNLVHYLNPLPFTAPIYKHHYGGFAVQIEDTVSTYNAVHAELPEDLKLKGTTYCIGGFYFLSRPNLLSIIKKRDEIGKAVIEDHAIGLNMDERFKRTLMCVNYTEYYKDMEKLDKYKMELEEYKNKTRR